MLRILYPYPPIIVMSFRKLIHSLFIIGLLLVPASCAVSNAEDLNQLEEQAMQQAVANIAPAVVRIETLGGLERIGRLLVGTGPTTGLVVSQDGYIISSAFNFIQQPTSILVTLPGGKSVSARMVARDHSRMLVLLKVDTDQPLTVPPAAPRAEMVVGQWAIAMGRALDPQHPNLSVGIISATHRIWGRAIQTDAKISPHNYGGPLVDIQGRVLGLLVPLSPHARSEVAGAEWYDSGIGFAIPLEDIFAHLEKLKTGKDLHPGVLGITLKGNDIYSLPAEIATCHPRGPAALAQLKPGDTIVEVDGMPIQRQAELKHLLGIRYAGEEVSLVVLRNEQRIESVVELADQLQPYEHPFLGILPMRDADGVVVRYVYPGSPADKGGIERADQIVRLAGQPVPDARALREALANMPNREDVEIQFRRGDRTETSQVTLGFISPEIPPQLPPARSAQPDPAGESPPRGVIPIKVPETANKCFAYVPDTYQPDVPHGLILWLHEPGGFDEDRLRKRWDQICRDRQLILLSPASSDPDKWHVTEIGFILKVLEEVLDRYEVDRNRIVVHGYQAGGTMAYLVGFTDPDRFRGIAAVDAPLPRRARPPGTDPLRRILIYTTIAKQSPLKQRISDGIDRLKQLRYPVTVIDQGASARHLDADELRKLARWIDSLDKI